MKRAAVYLCVLLAACQPAGDQPPEGRVPAANTTTSTGAHAGDEAIVVDTPQSGEELTSPLVLSGSADVFEANVSYRIVTEAKVLKRGFTTATCGSGCRGTFSVTVPFTVGRPTEATIEVFEESAENGEPLHQVDIEVTLLP
jgi:hypothetical protein